MNNNFGIGLHDNSNFEDPTRPIWANDHGEFIQPKNSDRLPHDVPDVRVVNAVLSRAAKDEQLVVIKIN